MTAVRGTSEWLGKIPPGWQVIPFRRVFRESSEVNGETPVGPMLSVSGYRGVEIKQYEFDTQVRGDDMLENYRVVRPGQLAVNTMWLNYAGLGMSELTGHMSPAYRAYDLVIDASRRYLHYLLRSDGYVRAYTGALRGIRPNSLQMARADLMTWPVLLPPREQQVAIADFLDRETAKIDGLIAKQREMIDVLTEHVDADWSARYLNLPGRDVMVARLIVSIVDGPFGSALTSAHYSDAGVRVIRLGNIGIGVFRDHDQAYVPADYGRQLAAHAARPGDVVMAGLGDDKMPLGRAAVVPEGLGPAIVKADCYRLRPRSDLVLPEFLAWGLSSPPVRAQIALLARGATRARLNTGIARTVRVRVPPIDRQRACLEDWAAVSARLGVFMERASGSIALAQERRAALITAAVTGQLNIGEAA